MAGQDTDNSFCHDEDPSLNAGSCERAPNDDSIAVNGCEGEGEGDGVGKGDAAPEQEVLDFTNPFIKMSKKKLKRMRISAEEYIKEKRKRRALEKQRKKARRAAAVAAGEELPKRARKNNMSDSNCKQRIAIDMSFYNKMSIRDVNRTISQLSFCYAANRRSENPTQLTIAHLDGIQKQMFFSNSTRHGWDVNIKEETLSELFPRESIIYLTADSENVLETLDDSKVYVIGGLLDHNAHKNLCLNVAQEQNFAHARLPIDEYVKLNSRKVLTINQVFEILLRYLESGSWEDAFYKVIPKRKMTHEEHKTVQGTENLEDNDDLVPVDESHPAINHQTAEACVTTTETSLKNVDDHFVK